MSKLVIIDGNAILHRAFHALPLLKTKSGEPVNAVYGFISMFLRIIQDLKPNYLAIAFDTKGPTFRHKEFPLYQAQRPRISEDLFSQFDKVREIFKAIGIPIYEMSGFEADDIIGTITEKVQLKKFKLNTNKLDEVVVVSGDRDLLQLVNKKVRIYSPVVGLTKAKLMGVEDVVEKIGIKPEQIPDYKALVGDVSDNYPGVPGIGPKTAVELIKKFENVEGIIKNLKRIPRKTSEKIQNRKDKIKLYLRLATIARNVPLDFNLSQCSLWDIDNPKVIELFQKLGFKTLTKRIKKIGKELESERQMSLV